MARPQMRTRTSLLSLYEAAPEHREYLVDLCRHADKAGWLQPHHSGLGDVYTAYISFESEATGVRDYESSFVPGLFQTEGYVRALIRGSLPTASEQFVEDRVQTRLTRQAVLTRDEPLQFWAVIDEAALHRQVGGPAVHRAQLAHLAAAERPNITVQVIPFRGGAHPGMPGQFTIMDFADERDDDLVHIDGMAGDVFVENPAKVAGYATMFERLRAVALSPADSAALITELSIRGGEGP